ncbi:MAG: hypothetical protein WBL50_20380 [Candidatus Acidiferrum sp.]
MPEPKTHLGERRDGRTDSRYTRWRNFLVPIAIVAFVLLLAVLFLPTMDGPNSRVRANESVAAANPRNITTFQNRYAALHPNDGFACDLTLLKSVMHDKNDHEPDAFLPAGHIGYRIVLMGCEAGPNGSVTRYKISAIPVAPGKSGVRAFCTDETGVLWYDEDGSAENCLTAHHTID